ncbi:hypothetical protein OAL19_00805 [bacterium]|nr:hypothetical protein [bacterium]
MKILRRLNGTVIWNSGDSLLLSSKDKISYSKDQGKTFDFAVRLPVIVKEKLKLQTKLGRRLFRREIRQVIEISDHFFLLLVGKSIFLMDAKSQSINLAGSLPGSASLRMAWDGENLIYGEYFGNKERTAVPIWISDNLGNSWRKIFCFHDIRHVHGVIFDPFQNCFWITTGDYGQEAAIWKMESDLTQPKEIIRGDQNCRAIDLLVFEDSLIYGTDTPLTQNKIFKIDKSGNNRVELQNVGGSVFYLERKGLQVFCTTAVEPSDFNDNAYTELWTCNLSNTSKWQKLCKFKKDFWHVQIFQFGQIKIPAGEGSRTGIWITPFATKCDQTSLFIGLENA